MTRLPYDYSRCLNDACDLRTVCLRATPGRPGYQAFSAFPGGDDCHALIRPEDRT